MADTDPLTAALAGIRKREQAATRGPWWFDDGELTWRLHGVHAIVPPAMEGFQEQVINHQILKAPKSGTQYAEYWPGEADAEFIVHARADVPLLLGLADVVLKLHGCEPWYLAAADCGHLEPDDDMSDEWADWDDTHPPGSGDVGRVCRMTQIDAYCPECTRTAYGDEEPEGDCFVSAPCGTRSALHAALTGKEQNGG